MQIITPSFVGIGLSLACFAIFHSVGGCSKQASVDSPAASTAETLAAAPARQPADRTTVHQSTGAWKRALVDACGDADRVVISKVEQESGRRHEVRGTDAVSSLLNLIDINEESSGTECKCHGEIKLEFFRGETRVVVIALAHRKTVKWPDGDWNGDAVLTRESEPKVYEWIRDARNRSGRKQRGENTRNFKQPQRKKRAHGRTKDEGEQRSE